MSMFTPAKRHSGSRVAQTLVDALAAASMSARRARVAAPRRRAARIAAKRVVRPKTRTAGRTVVLSKKKKTYTENHSIENRQTSLVVNAPAARALTLAKACMEPQWNRVQGLSQFDTSTGFYPLANRNNGSGMISLPMHVWDITCSPNVTQPGNTIIVPDVGYSCTMGVVGGSNASAGVNTINSQNPDGATIFTAAAQYENISGGYDDLPKRKLFHEWTSIKLNLYGVRKRATKYLVQLVTVKDEGADFITGNSSNLEKLKLYDYLARPFMYNNLNSGDPQSKSKIKIHKTYETIIGPTTLDEVGGATATPHMQTLNWFIRHNTVRRYDWSRGAIPATLTNAGFDQEIGVNSTRVHPERRIYLMVRALSPEVRASADDRAAADPQSEPSYDCVIRNKFLNPT